MSNNKAMDLSPDGYSRFYILVDVLNQIYSNREDPIKILDVGGGSEFLFEELKDKNIQFDLTVLDIIEKPKKIKTKYIQGDATNMDLKDGSYEVVLSTDVMEHIPEIKKQNFLDECLRVASDLCIIAAPFDTEGVNDAEIVVNDFNKKLFGVGQNWLDEHLLYGKPKIEMFVKTLNQKNINFFDFGTQNLNTWLLNTQINLIDAKLGLNSTLHKKVNRFYNANIMSMNEFDSPTYRHFFVMFNNSELIKDFDIKKYTKNNKNNKNIANYSNMLINLTAERISSLKKKSEQLELKSYNLLEDNRKLKEINTALESKVEYQNNVLKKLDLIVKIYNALPLKPLRTNKSKNKR